jgi:hypothetical protein
MAGVDMSDTEALKRDHGNSQATGKSRPTAPQPLRRWVSRNQGHRASNTGRRKTQ